MLTISLFPFDSVMSSTSPKKPVTNENLLESLELLKGDLYDLSVLIHQFIDDNAESPNNVNREKLLNFVCEVKKLSAASRDLQSRLLDMDCEAFLKK